MTDFTPRQTSNQMTGAERALELDTRFFEKNPNKRQRMRAPIPGEFDPLPLELPAGALILVKRVGNTRIREVVV